ncbi:MAG: universal stress protein [Acidobacteria bacterium]|nr:universal stress protein [Acidobacteriota bacterium]
MIAINKILVPTDFSECSDAAVLYGRAMAETFGATLHLLHVVQDPYTQPWAAEAFPAPLGDMLAQWQAQARARLQELLPETARKDVMVAVQVGSPFQEIVRYANEQAIDLIVIGTHGRGPIGHMLLGSVAEKVVRKAPCPVLTVREHG